MALDFKSPICIYVPTNQPIFPLPILFRWDQIYQNLENLENGAALYRAVVRLNISGNIWDRVKSLFVSLSLSFCLCLCHYICLFVVFVIVIKCHWQRNSISLAISGTGSNQRGIEPSLLGSFIPKYWSVTLQNIQKLKIKFVEQQERNIRTGINQRNFC